MSPGAPLPLARVMNHHLLKLSLKIFFLVLGITGHSVSANALEHWHIPIENEMKTVRVINRDNEPHTVWLSGPIEKYQDPMEISFDIQAFGTLEIPLNEYSQFPWIHLKAQNTGLFQMQVQTVYEDPFLISTGPGSRWKGRVRPQSSAVILNLAASEQTVTLTNQIITQTFKIPALGKLRTSLKDFAAGSMLSVEGESRISGTIISALGTKSLSVDNAPKILDPAASDGSHYFLVANHTRSQSFVVEISDPVLLMAAKKQIESPLTFQPRILIGQIGLGHNNHNRDFADPRRTPWSWNVTRVIGFAELASQECDGSPEMLEEVLTPWFNSHSNICFWNYRLKEEIPWEQVRTGIVPSFQFHFSPDIRPK